MLPHFGLWTQLGQPSAHGHAWDHVQRRGEELGQFLETLLGNADPARKSVIDEDLRRFGVGMGAVC